MPRISAFYGEHEATIVIATAEVLQLTLPTRALRLVQEWATQHRGELEREPLRDERLFREVRIDEELGTIVWPNGADLDPTVLRGDLPAV